MRKASLIKALVLAISLGFYNFFIQPEYLTLLNDLGCNWMGTQLFASILGYFTVLIIAYSLSRILTRRGKG